MNEEILEILSDESNVDFAAKTNYTARIKFQRLLKKYPSSHDYGRCLIEASRDLQDEREYDKFLVWLANPKKVTGERNPHPSCTKEALPDMSELKIKYEPTFVEINHESVKDIPNAVFIHIKNVGDDAEPEEKIEA